MARRKLSHEGTLVLDCEGLSKFVSDHEPVVALVAEARKRGMEVVLSALTIIEAVHSRTDKARLAWALSGMRIVPIGDEEAKAASAMLIGAGLHGHKYAIDAAVAEMALRQRRPVVMLTSDVDDMAKLCGDRVRLVAVNGLGIGKRR
ncbi:DNA-binding protein [Streptomyces sp. NBC_01340]|uniref:DNA-binding protein n=1 Tax=unclassified Streptomyces TaxID=2593676 RepID=UPI00224D7364|nr:MULTISPECIES: DNA-binding protein [unclassified Streptomyces]MCX4454301.1 DNA-binding protein [Streptomyces sp. NBC_01719]MCX4493661.1 DNA-binding protein [Streptomyces sp. NBC_01728]WSI38767.1 DNA-binding protein [Streptomyces sp. NBC_01340]